MLWRGSGEAPSPAARPALAPAARPVARRPAAVAGSDGANPVHKYIYIYIYIYTYGESSSTLHVYFYRRYFVSYLNMAVSRLFWLLGLIGDC